MLWGMQTDLNISEAIELSNFSGVEVPIEASVKYAVHDLNKLRVKFKRHDIKGCSIFVNADGNFFRVKVHDIAQQSVEQSTTFPTWAWLGAGFGIIALSVDIYLHMAISWPLK